MLGSGLREFEQHSSLSTLKPQALNLEAPACRGMTPAEVAGPLGTTIVIEVHTPTPKGVPRS